MVFCKNIGVPEAEVTEQTRRLEETDPWFYVQILESLTYPRRSLLNLGVSLPLPLSLSPSRPSPPVGREGVVE